MSADTQGNALAREGDVLFVRVKAVPGASRDAIAGLLGDRVKVRVAAPPEGGRANEAIRALLATALGLKTREVEVVSGDHSPEKVLRATGFAGTIEEAARRLGLV